MSELKENTVRQTLFLPLCGRMIAAQNTPHLFPDKDAECIVRELGGCFQAGGVPLAIYVDQLRHSTI